MKGNIMGLSYDQLIQFNLLDEAEQKVVSDQAKFVDFFRILQEITTTDSFIRDCPSFPGSTDSIIRDELASAIGSTLAIEGIVLREDEIKEALKPTSREDRIRRQNQYASNSRDVYRYIQKVVLKNKEEFVFKDKHITTIHKLFTKNIGSIGNTPGAYRNTSASFGDPRKISLCRSYADIYQAIKLFVDWLNRETSGLLTSNPVTKAIMAHYYLAEIHPFGDGNGRTARAIEALILYQNGINIYCFWSLANFWSNNRNEYITHLGDIRDTCNPIDFMLWGARGYLEEIKRIKERVLKKLKSLMLRDYVSWLFRAKKELPPGK